MKLQFYNLYIQIMRSLPYEIIWRLKYFYTNRERYDVPIRCLSFGHRHGGDWANIWHWTKRFNLFLLSCPIYQQHIQVKHLRRANGEASLIKGTSDPVSFMRLQHILLHEVLFLLPQMCTARGWRTYGPLLSHFSDFFVKNMCI